VSLASTHTRCVTAFRVRLRTRAQPSRGCVCVCVCVCVPDVVFASSEVTRPVARLPEAEAVHLPPALAERRVAVRRPLQVEVAQLLQVRPHDLEERRRDDVTARSANSVINVTQRQKLTSLNCMFGSFSEYIFNLLTKNHKNNIFTINKLLHVHFWPFGS